MYCRLICPVRSPTNILQCFLSSLFMNWTYLSVCSSRYSSLFRYFSQTSHYVCFLFSIQFLILDLNLFKDNGRKGSGPIGLVLAPSLASLSAVSFCWIQPCPGTYIMVTWFTSDRTVSFSIQSAASSDFVSLAARAATAAWLSVLIVICSFISLFLRQLITQSSIATTSAWKTVASCPSEMCHCILLWYLHIPAPVPCWLQAPSVNQTCPFQTHSYHPFLKSRHSFFITDGKFLSN